MGKLTVLVWLAVVLTPALVRSVELLEEDSLQELEGGSEPMFLQETPRTEKLLKLILGEAFLNYKPKPKPAKRVKRCANLLDDSCINGQYLGSGGDGDYFGSGGSPGKRSIPSLLDIFKRLMENQGKNKRCANLLDDSCINGQYPGSGGDGDYFGSGGSPGKRSIPPLIEIFKNQMETHGKDKRCANLLDDSCINGQYPGSGGDGDYFGSGGSPGKRSSAPLVTIYQNKIDNKGKLERRCVNLLDDSCINGQYPGSGGDGDYFGSVGSPGKRSLSIEQILEHFCLRGHDASCRLLRM